MTLHLAKLGKNNCIYIPKSVMRKLGLSMGDSLVIRTGFGGMTIHKSDIIDRFEVKIDDIDAEVRKFMKRFL